MVGQAGAIEDGRAVPFGLGKSILPFVGGFAGDDKAQASHLSIPQSLGFLKPAIASTAFLFWRKLGGGYGLTSFLVSPCLWFLPKNKESVTHFYRLHTALKLPLDRNRPFVVMPSTKSRSSLGGQGADFAGRRSGRGKGGFE